jgi:hypothetical protein
VTTKLSPPLASVVLYSPLSANSLTTSDLSGPIERFAKSHLETGVFAAHMRYQVQTRTGLRPSLMLLVTALIFRTSHPGPRILIRRCWKTLLLKEFYLNLTSVSSWFLIQVILLLSMIFLKQTLKWLLGILETPFSRLSSEIRFEIYILKMQ